MILTYSQQLSLVEQGLAKSSVNGKFTTFKYAKKVMYDYLWDKHPELKYCRGQTYDNTNGNLVALPPAKTFNYLENDTWKDVPLDTTVYLYKKYNGFMAAVSVYNDEVVISTTGSTKSEYVELASKSIFKEYPKYLVKDWGENATWLFEICHESDPHIVNEKLGVHYLGCSLHNTAAAVNFIPMGKVIATTLGNALQLAKEDRGEGFMMYDNQSNCCKLKTDYYVGKKKLMRMNNRNVERMYNNGFEIAGTLPEMWYNFPRKIISAFGKQSWLEMTDQQRRIYIEAIEGDTLL